MHSVSTPVVLSAGFSKWPAVLALGMGLFLALGAGLANPAAIHNATHDTRHAFGLPCH